MGSISSITECPNCKNEETFYDFNYKTGGHWISCNKCGYNESNDLIISIDSNGEYKEDGYDFKVWFEKLDVV